MNQDLLPKCIEAEQSLIGAVLRKKRLANELLAELSPDDFYDERNRVAYLIIQKYTEKFKDIVNDDPFELPLLMDILYSSNIKGKDNGLISYLSKLYAYNQPCAIAGYIEIVRKYSALRKAIANGSQVVAEAYDVRDPDIIAYKLEQLSKEIMSRNTNDIISLRDAIAQMNANTSTIRYHTGIADFDRINGGFAGGELIIIAGRPGMGKTTLAINIARTGLSVGKRVGFFSIEMSASQIAKRFLLLEKTFKSTDPENYLLDIKAGRTSLSIVSSYLEKAKAHGKNINLIVIDYLQIMDAPGHLRREEQISFLTRSLKQLAAEHNIPIIAISQLNRKCEERKSPRPVMSDLRDSGAIEQDADIILFVYREEVYNKLPQFKGKAEIIIGKYRSGAAGNSIKMLFEPEHARFKNLIENYEPPF